ncbi:MULTISPECIES: YwiC-like family protein [Brevibacillus]|uniref:YwiC-like family protein n=1 Tax=Brevibacillus TaxID=55080 RepID=UPI0002717EE6|nr:MULTISPECIES: YwiC-like family protein [Brevibacillus]EJL46332.1 hypothetical protein PMI08_01200 [Brevibacillus sp. CF112]MED1826122.1 YwiC-like family protein [Brevibacillus agri]
MDTTGVLIFIGCYFLLSALFGVMLYRRAKRTFARKGWLVAAGAVLIGAVSPFFIAYTSLWLWLSVFLLLAVCLAWGAWKLSAVPVRRGGFAPVFSVPATAELGRQHPWSLEEAADEQQDEGVPAVSELEQQHESEHQHEHELEHDLDLELELELEEEVEQAALAEVAVSQEEGSLPEIRDEDEAISYDFLQEEEAETIPFMPALEPPSAKIEAEEADEDRIIYFFEEESPAEKKTMPDTTERTDVGKADEHEWNFIHDDKQTNE